MGSSGSSEHTGYILWPHPLNPKRARKHLGGPAGCSSHRFACRTPTKGLEEDRTAAPSIPTLCLLLRFSKHTATMLPLVFHKPIGLRQVWTCRFHTRRICFQSNYRKVLIGHITAITNVFNLCHYGMVLCTASSRELSILYLGRVPCWRVSAGPSLSLFFHHGITHASQAKQTLPCGPFPASSLNVRRSLSCSLRISWTQGPKVYSIMPKKICILEFILILSFLNPGVGLQVLESFWLSSKPDLLSPNLCQGRCGTAGTLWWPHLLASRGKGTGKRSLQLSVFELWMR